MRITFGMGWHGMRSQKLWDEMGWDEVFKILGWDGMRFGDWDGIILGRKKIFSLWHGLGYPK